MSSPRLRSPCGNQIVIYERKASDQVKVVTISFAPAGIVSVHAVAMPSAAAREDWKEAVDLGFTVRAA